MKIRHGFVSNSSSSSFVILATKDRVKEVLNSFNSKDRKFLKSVLNTPEKVKFNGKDYVEYLGVYDTDSLIDVYMDIFNSGDDEAECSAIDLFKKFVKSFNKYVDSHGTMYDF